MISVALKVTHSTRASGLNGRAHWVSDANYFLSLTFSGVKLTANMASVHKDSDENNPDLSPTSPVEESDTAPVPEPEPKPGLHGVPVRCEYLSEVYNLS